MEFLSISENMSTSFYGNTTNNYMPSYVIPFNNQWTIASTTILVLFFVFGVFANSITIIVICSTPKLRSQYNFFLASICVSDNISAMVSILFLYRRIWGFLYFAWPEILCKLYWAVDFWTTFATSLHIVSYATLRLIGVQWLPAFKQLTRRIVKIWIASIWIVAFLGGFIPHFVFNTVNVIDRDNDERRVRWASCSLSSYWFSTWQVYVQFGYTIYLYVPAIAIIVISLAISIILWRKRFIPGESCTRDNLVMMKNLTKKVKQDRMLLSASGRRWSKRKRIIYQLFLIVSSFLFGYIPLTAFHFFTGFTVETSNAEMNAVDWRFAMIQYMMLRFSECLNPVFYNAASPKMRRETLKMLRKLFGRKLRNKFIAVVS